MINVFDFSDQLDADESLRKRFATSYVQCLANELGADGIAEMWEGMMVKSIVEECKYKGADGVVARVANSHPSFLESEFNVDVSLVID